VRALPSTCEKILAFGPCRNLTAAVRAEPYVTGATTPSLTVETPPALPRDAQFANTLQGPHTSAGWGTGSMPVVIGLDCALARLHILGR